MYNHFRVMRRVFIVGLMLVFSVIVASANVVTPGDPNGWAGGAETGTGTVQLVTGPGMPPLGNGSIEFTLDSAASGMVFGTFQFAGTRFDEITAITYSTYTTMSLGSRVPSLQINVDYDLNDSDTTWQGRLVFEPYYDNTIVDGVWQTWNARAGRWWQTGTPRVGNAVVAQQCPISSPCTFDALLGFYPNMGIRVSDGLTLLKAGSNWQAGYVGNVDGLTLTINGATTTTFFEEVPFVGGTVAGCDGLNIIGRVLLTQTAFGYGEPGGQVIRNANGSEMNVFNDAGNDGFDTFLLVDIAERNGKTWYGVFLGVCVPIYIDADLATRIP